MTMATISSSSSDVTVGRLTAALLALASAGKVGAKKVLSTEQKLLRQLRRQCRKHRQNKKQSQGGGDGVEGEGSTKVIMATTGDHDSIGTSYAAFQRVLVQTLASVWHDKPRVRRFVMPQGRSVLVWVGTSASDDDADSNNVLGLRIKKAGSGSTFALYVLRWLCRLSPSGFWRGCRGAISWHEQGEGEAAMSNLSSLSLATPPLPLPDRTSPIPPGVTGVLEVVNFFGKITAKVGTSADATYSAAWTTLLDQLSHFHHHTPSVPNAIQPTECNGRALAIAELRMLIEHLSACESAHSVAVVETAIQLANFACRYGPKQDPATHQWKLETFTCFSPSPPPPSQSQSQSSESQKTTFGVADVIAGRELVALFRTISTQLLPCVRNFNSGSKSAFAFAFVQQDFPVHLHQALANCAAIAIDCLQHTFALVTDAQDHALNLLENAKCNCNGNGDGGSEPMASGTDTDGAASFAQSAKASRLQKHFRQLQRGLAWRWLATSDVLLAKAVVNGENSSSSSNNNNISSSNNK